MENNIDLTRLNRHERRAYGSHNGVKIPGRNLPYVTKMHGTVENYYSIREKEIKAEEDNLKSK